VLYVRKSYKHVDCDYLMRSIIVFVLGHLEFHKIKRR